MVFTKLNHLNFSGQQIVTQLVSGQQVAGSIIQHQPAPGTTVVATSLPSGLAPHQVINVFKQFNGWDMHVYGPSKETLIT